MGFCKTDLMQNYKHICKIIKTKDFCKIARLFAKITNDGIFAK